VSIAPWSYSKIKAFEQCPKKFYHLKVAKDYSEPETEAMRYGTEFHLACEEYVRDDKPLPPQFGFVKDSLDALIAKQGEKLCEYKMGLTANLEACDFFADDVWYRGIADLIILDGDLAWVVDYKTGRSDKHADVGQLELMALAVFKHFPDVKRVKAGLMFVVPKSLIRAEYGEPDSTRLWKKWLTDYSSMEKAMETGVWNPRPSGLCKKHCIVTECVHNGRN